MYTRLLWKNMLIFEINISFRPIFQKLLIFLKKYPEKYATRY